MTKKNEYQSKYDRMYTAYSLAYRSGNLDDARRLFKELTQYALDNGHKAPKTKYNLDPPKPVIVQVLPPAPSPSIKQTMHNLRYPCSGSNSGR